MRRVWTVVWVGLGLLACGGAEVRTGSPTTPETPRETPRAEGGDAGVGPGAPAGDSGQASETDEERRLQVEQAVREVVARARSGADPTEVRERLLVLVGEGNAPALAYANLAIAELRLGEAAAAADHAWKAVELSGASERSLALAREAFSRAGRGGDLAERLEALSRTLPESPALRLALAEAFVLADRPADALREATEVLRQDETRVEAMAVMARAYLAMKRLDAAEYVAVQALEVRRDPSILALLGHLAWHQGDATRAMGFYQESVKEQPDQPDIWNNLSALYQAAGDADAAEQAASRALRLDPTYRAAWLNLGNARRARRDIPAAIAAYQEALRLDPDCADCEFNLGIAEMENRPLEQDEPGHWRRAIEHFSRFRAMRRGQVRPDPVLEAYLDEARRNAEFLEKEQQRLREAPAPQGPAPGEPSGDGGADPGGGGVPQEPEGAAGRLLDPEGANGR